jgi:hypothetical protein
MVEQTSAAARNLLSEVNGLADRLRFRSEAAGGAACRTLALPSREMAAPPAQARQGRQLCLAGEGPARPAASRRCPVGRCDDDWKDF